jgi:hypothetical protein
MAERDLVDLGLMLMDRQLVDVNGRRCGKVDDIELDGGPGERPTVTTILTGPAAWAGGGRGPLAWLAARLAHGDVVRIGLDDVATMGAKIELGRSAEELGLSEAEDRAASWLRGWPGA